MKLIIGSQIAYSAAFLDSICEDATGDLWGNRGRIVDFEVYGDITLAVVVWSNGEEARVNCNNLALVGPNLRFNRL